MRLSQTSNESIYKYEILRARSEIRDHFSRTFIRDIYENSGQLLSLIRMKLAVAMHHSTNDAGKELSASGEMLAMVSKNLKQISKLLFPETEILSEWGFVNALRQELATNKNQSGNELEVKGYPCVLVPGSAMILFQAIIEITNMIKNNAEESDLLLEVVYTKKRMKVFIRYRGDASNVISLVKGTDHSHGETLTIEQRIGLIDAAIKFKSLADDWQEVQLILNI